MFLDWISLKDSATPDTMPFSKTHLFTVLLAAMLFACGGGGDTTATQPQAAAIDTKADHLGTWALDCQVTVPLGADPSEPGGLSEDEVLTVSKLGEQKLSITSVVSRYNNTICSTSTSYYRGFPNTSHGDFAGIQDTAAGDAGKWLLMPQAGGPSYKALIRVQGATLYMARSDAAGSTLTTDGYPLALDTTRPYRKAAP